MTTMEHYAEINPTPGHYDRPSDTEVAFVPMSAVSEDGRLENQVMRPLSEVVKGYTCFRRGDVLLAKITPCMENGKAALVDDLATDLGFGSTEFHVLRARPGVHPRFLFYLVWNQRFRDAAAKHMTGSAGQKRVPTSFLRNVSVPVVRPSEQRRIADTLDKADAIRRNRRKALAHMEDLLRSVFLQMFGDPLANPKGWPSAPFSEVVHDATGGNPKLQQGEYLVSGAFPVIDQGTAFVGGWTNDRTLVAKVSLPAVLFGDHTKVLKWVEQPFALGADGVKVLVPGKLLMPEYIYMACQMFPFPDVGYSRHFKFLKLWSVPMPPLELQREYASRFVRIREALQVREQALREAEALFSSLVGRAFPDLQEVPC